jgi:hypothetical protein
MKTTIDYVAELTHVREVSLLGTADLAFWKDRLLKEELVPAEADGRAQLLVVAADAGFMGVRFRELSFSVLISLPGDRSRQDGAFLVQAFNSIRFFAFCERAFFATPYFPGDVRVSISAPVSIQLGKGGAVVFRAEMPADPSTPGRSPSRTGEDGWAGPVFLPANRGKDGPGNVFFARLGGQTQTYPFLPTEDKVVIEPSPDAEVLQALLDSGFAGKEWAVRADATHAKSKTYKRSGMP